MAGKKGLSGRKSKAEELGLQGLLNKAWPVAERIKLFAKLAEMARDGNIEAIKLLTAYTFGKPTENHNVIGVQEIRVVYGSGSNTSD